MVQHLLLIMVAAPLFAISSPIDLSWRASTGPLHERFTGVLRSRAASVLGHPGVAFVAYAVLIPLTHLTVWYNYTLEHPAIDDVEHLIFLGLGYLFWRQIFGSDPNRYRLHPALKFGYLFLAIPIDTFTGLSLDQRSHEMFPAYLAFHRTWGPSLVDDLHIGGVLMWVAGDTLMLWPMIPVALGWMHLEERKAVRIDRQLDAADEASDARLAEFLAGPSNAVGSRRTPVRRGPATLGRKGLVHGKRRAEGGEHRRDEHEKVSTWTAVHHRQMASILKSSV